MDWSFGLTMTLMGMGVTFFTLLVLIFVIHGLSRIFPVKPDEKSGGKE